MRHEVQDGIHSRAPHRTAPRQQTFGPNSRIWIWDLGREYNSKCATDRHFAGKAGTPHYDVLVSSGIVSYLIYSYKFPKGCRTPRKPLLERLRLSHGCRAWWGAADSMRTPLARWVNPPQMTGIGIDIIDTCVSRPVNGATKIKALPLRRAQSERVDHGASGARTAVVSSRPQMLVSGSTARRAMRRR